VWGESAGVLCAMRFCGNGSNPRFWAGSQERRMSEPRPAAPGTTKKKGCSYEHQADRSHQTNDKQVGTFRNAHPTPSRFFLGGSWGPGPADARRATRHKKYSLGTEKPRRSARVQSWECCSGLSGLGNESDVATLMALLEVLRRDITNLRALILTQGEAIMTDRADERQDTTGVHRGRTAAILTCALPGDIAQLDHRK
jgi:hypothetical protein